MSDLDYARVRNRLFRDINFLRAPEGYLRAGYPDYYTLFGRDSLIAAWQLLDYDAAIAASTLRVLSDLQGKKLDDEHEEEPGKILHEWWGDLATRVPESKPGIPWPFPYYGSVDSTFLYLLLASYYYQKTKDDNFLLSLQPHILAAVDWVFSRSDLNGDLLVDYSRRNPKGLFNQGWRDSSSSSDETFVLPITLVEVQGYKYAALKQLKAVLRLYGERALEAQAEKAAADTRRAFLEKFWWEEERYFYFLFDKNGSYSKTVTSNPGQLLFTGILPADKERAVVERLFREDMWTPYGIRTQSTHSRDFNPTAYQKGSIWPHDNWIIAQGLKAGGHAERYQQIKTVLLRVYEELDKIPELYSVGLDNHLLPSDKSNDLQAWTTGALINLIMHD